MDREQDGQGAEWIESGKDREWGGRRLGEVEESRGGGGEWERWRGAERPRKFCKLLLAPLAKSCKIFAGAPYSKSSRVCMHVYNSRCALSIISVCSMCGCMEWYRCAVCGVRV